MVLSGVNPGEQRGDNLICYLLPCLLVFVLFLTKSPSCLFIFFAIVCDFFRCIFLLASSCTFFFALSCTFSGDGVEC